VGRGATATIERLAASLGELDEAEPRFEAALDIPRGGVFVALPALMLSGLLRHADKYFRLAFMVSKTNLSCWSLWRLPGSSRWKRCAITRLVNVRLRVNLCFL
jgi:hypothetical protein